MKFAPKTPAKSADFSANLSLKIPRLFLRPTVSEALNIRPLLPCPIKYYMFVNNIVFSLVDSFLAWRKHLSPCMGASQPLHVGNFCTLKKQVEMIFMGLSGRCPLSPHMQHSFLCPLIPSTCYASYSNLPHVPYFIQIKATKNFKFDSTQFVNLIEAGFKPDTENWPSRRHAFP